MEVVGLYELSERLNSASVHLDTIKQLLLLLCEQCLNENRQEPLTVTNPSLLDPVQVKVKVRDSAECAVCMKSEQDDAVIKASQDSHPLSTVKQKCNIWHIWCYYHILNILWICEVHNTCKQFYMTLRMCSLFFFSVSKLVSVFWRRFLYMYMTLVFINIGEQRHEHPYLYRLDKCVNIWNCSNF